jgi:hypothetical protein
MTSQEIKDSKFYKSLSELSNNDRGILFEKYSSEIEKAMNVKLVKHSYTELGKIKTDNPMISYQENWESYTGSLIALMEFVPQ